MGIPSCAQLGRLRPSKERPGRTFTARHISAYMSGLRERTSQEQEDCEAGAQGAAGQRNTSRRSNTELQMQKTHVGKALQSGCDR
jgi:hypothetical protein